MKGLLKKEFYIIWKNFRVYFILCAAFLVYGLWSSNNFFMLFYPAMLCSMIPVSIINFDEKFGWDLYSLTFPLSRKQLVSCKYFISLICSSAICVVYTSVWAGRLLLIGDYGEAMTTLSVYLPTLITIVLLPPAILLPCVFKFGSQKGAYAYYAVLAGLGAMIAVFLSVADMGDVIAFFQTADRSLFPILLLPLAAAVLFALSWPLSTRIYEKKSF